MTKRTLIHNKNICKEYLKKKIIIINKKINIKYSFLALEIIFIFLIYIPNRSHYNWDQQLHYLNILDLSFD